MEKREDLLMLVVCLAGVRMDGWSSKNAIQQAMAPVKLQESIARFSQGSGG